MKKSLRTFLSRSIVVLLLLTFLTFSVGKVKKVEAVATTTAVIAEVLLGLGVTYIAYQTLTGANVYLPNFEETEMYEYIRGLGREFSYTRSGDTWYQRLYNRVINGQTEEVHLTRDDLIELYNYNKDVDTLQRVSSYDFTNDLDITPLNGFLYPFEITNVPEKLSDGRTFNELISGGYIINQLTGTRMLYTTGEGYYSIVYTDLSDDYEYRNVKTPYGKYVIGRSIDGVIWGDGYYGCHGGYEYYNGSNHGYFYPTGTMTYYRPVSLNTLLYNYGTYDYPILPDKPIWDSQTQEYLPLVPVDVSGRQLTPQYPQNNDPNGNKYPIVPYVELPTQNNWGFNWRNALTDIINRSGQLITASWIGNLINQFKNALVGSPEYNEYSYYNEGDTYYFEYYNNAINNEYPTYNINISNEENIIPVDLNTVSQYTDNQFLSALKERARAAGYTFAEYVAFWHNCDPEIVYVLLGSGILILLGAFIGKWGHS